MPKQKTHKSTAKRMKITGSGKVMRNRSGRRHLLSHKSAERRRRLRRSAEVTGLVARKVKRFIS